MESAEEVKIRTAKVLWHVVMVPERQNRTELCTCTCGREGGREGREGERGGREESDIRQGCHDDQLLTSVDTGLLSDLPHGSIGCGIITIATVAIQQRSHSYRCPPMALPVLLGTST